MTDKTSPPGSGKPRRGLLAALSALSICGVAHAIPTGFSQKTILNIPDAVSSCVLPDGRILGVEKYGKISMYKNGVQVSTPVLNWESKTNEDFEKGMMGCLADPAFPANGYVYVQYTSSGSGGNGRDQVSRFKMNGDVLDPSSEKVMIDMGDAGAQYHHGSGMAVGPDGKLYIASGCRGGGNVAVEGQNASKDKNNPAGKILRINIPEGDIPADNPFFAENSGPGKAVYYMGLRNPFTLSFRAKTGALWFSDVQGAKADDEVNEGGPAGTDYGYYQRAGKAPLWKASSVGQDKGAMIGSLWYGGGSFPAEWQDHYFFGNVWDKGLMAFTESHSGNPKAFAPEIATPIDIKMDAAGSIYVTQRGQTQDARYGSGKVIKIWYGTEPSPVITPDKISAAQAARHLRWSVHSRGRIQVEPLVAGPQTVELLTLDGRMIAKLDFDGRGRGELSAHGPGAHVLAWRSGTERAMAKLMIP